MKIVRWRLFDLVVQILLFCLFIGLSFNFKIKIAAGFYVVSVMFLQSISHFFVFFKNRSFATNWRKRFHAIFKVEVLLFLLGIALLFTSILFNSWAIWHSLGAWTIISVIIACSFLYFFVSLREFFVSKKLVEQSEIVDLSI